jgi:hypothetical protein
MFQLTVYNSYGETRSEWTRDLITAEHTPAGQEPPRVIEFGSNNTVVEWRQPSSANGIITSYQILVFKCLLVNESSFMFGEPSRDLALNVTLEKDDLYSPVVWANTIRYNVTSLEAFTYYLFTVSGCNSAGCAMSPVSKNFTTDPTLIRTKPYLPQYFEGKKSNIYR